MPPDNVHSLETQRAIASLSAPLSKHVGAAAALEAARNFLQVQVSTEGTGERFDAVAVARNIVQTRVDAPEAYGKSWKNADVTELATLLAFAWVDACGKDDKAAVDAAREASSSGRPPEADF